MRFLTFLCFLLISLAAASQQKGQLILGGQLFFDSSTEQDSTFKQTNTQFEGGPLAGLMITDRIAVGVSLAYISDYRVQEDFLTNFSSVSDIRTMYVGIFSRLHGNFTEKFIYTVQLDLGKDFRLNGFSPHPQIYKARAGAGLMYFVAKKVALGMDVISFNGRFENHKERNEYKRTDLSLDYNFLNPRFQVLFYL
ncbi:MAG: hypothetical protein ACPF8V_00360 [Luteibaculum sp.]